MARAKRRRGRADHDEQAGAGNPGEFSVKYLLDVNALVAMGFLEHEFHKRVRDWVNRRGSKELMELATCPITELGFVRVLSSASQYGFTVAQARALLRQLKAITDFQFVFLTDDQEASRLPNWVKTSGQTTDGHLAELARARGAILATLDQKIPGTVLIPAKG
jgi:uncharacterized protein